MCDAMAGQGYAAAMARFVVYFLRFFFDRSASFSKAYMPK